MRTAADQIRASWPNCADLVDMIEAIAREVDRLPIEDFFEPTSLVEQSESKSRLLATSGADIKAWTRHVAYSSRLRLRALEEAALREIAVEQVLPAMVLARSHMEVAGFAALCQETLYRLGEKPDPNALEQLMLKTSLGTSLKRMAKHDATTRDFLLMSEQSTITISKAIKALENFRESPMHCQRVYALLCEYAHPNPRANKEFYDAEGGATEGGWSVSYRKSSAFSEDHARMALTILTDNARAGYASSELLRLAQIRDSDSGFLILYVAPAVNSL